MYLRDENSTSSDFLQEVDRKKRERGEKNCNVPQSTLSRVMTLRSCNIVIAKT